MILNIFLPRKIGATRLFSSRIVSFSVQENNDITAASVFVSRKKTVIEGVFKEIIEQGEEATFIQRAADTIKKILPKLKKSNEVHVSVPASIVVFKELTVPFLDAQKIRMVIDYEVEAMLPFALENAIVDFVILEQNKTQGSSTVLAVAARVQDLENILTMYTTAGIEPTHLVVDLLSVHGLYKQIAEYKALTKGSALIDIGTRFTRVVFLQDGKFRLMRNIMRGTTTIAENVSRETNIPLEKVLSILAVTGVAKINDENFDKSLEKHLMNLFNDIQFTLNSFSIKLNFQEDVTKLLFLGSGSQIKGMVTLSEATLQIPSELFETEKIFTNKSIKNGTTISGPEWNNYLFALSCALQSEELGEFNLRRKKLTLPEFSLVKRQWLTASTIVFALLVTLCSNGYLQVSYLSKTASQTENKEIQKLKSIFPADSKALKKTLVLKTMLKDAESVVAEKEEMWSPFSTQRLRPLEILQELTHLIDKKRFDVVIDELEITADNASPRIEISGFFKSKSGYHFQDFGLFQKSFLESKTLALTEEIDPTFAEDKGVKFTAKLKPKESA